MAFDDPQVFDDLQIISNASIDFNDPTDFDDPQMFGSKGTTIGSIDLIIFDGLVDVIANGLVFVHYLSTCPVLSLYLSSIYPPAQGKVEGRICVRRQTCPCPHSRPVLVHHLEFLSCQLRVKSEDDLLHASYHHIFLNKCLHHLEWSLHFESVSAVSEYTS